MSVFILGMNLNKPINCDRLAARPGTGDKALAIFADYHDMKATTPGHRPVIEVAPWVHLTPAPGVPRVTRFVCIDLGAFRTATSASHDWDTP